MTFPTPTPYPADAPIVEDWHTISEDLLRGLVHALNNRVASLSASVELAKLGDEEEDPLVVLPDEIAQLHRVNALFGLLPRRKAEAESLELRAVLDDAIALHEHHPRFRGGHVALTFEGAPAVVRAPRWALLRAMVMLVHAARLEAGTDGSRVDPTVGVNGDEQTVSVRVSTREPPSADLAALAARCGGRVTRTNDALVLTLPSLRELRRREREARGESPAG